MRQQIQYIISIFNNIGHPGILLMIKGNSSWPEIKNALITGRKALEPPDLSVRVFSNEDARTPEVISGKGVVWKGASACVRCGVPKRVTYKC